MAKSTGVKVIQRKGIVALVEWIDGDGLKRGVIPVNIIAKGRVDREELKSAIPYGIPWEKLLKVSATPQTVAAELRRVGIWTREDLEARPNQALSAIQAAYGVGLADLLRAVRQHE